MSEVKHGLHGQHGRDGLPGKDGRPGSPGIPGRDGRDGKDVDQAAVEQKIADEVSKIPRPKDGQKGDQGDAGLNGKDGQQGPRGPQGPQGPQGQQGPRGPQGSQGDLGPMPAHRWQGKALQFEQAPGNVWGDLVNLEGPPGKRGQGGGGAASGGAGGVAISASGNSLSSGTVIFSNSPSFTFGMAGNVITGSVAGSVTGMSAVNFSAGTTSNNRSDIVFADGNGVTFGFDNGTLTATVKTDYLTTAMRSDAATVFSNSNGVTFGLAGSTITASVKTDYLTTAMQSNAATISNIKASAGTQSSNLSALTFGDAHGVSFGLDNGTITASISPAGGGLTNINVSAGTTSNNLSALTFSDGSGISFGINGSVITATVATNYLTTAMASDASSAFAGTGFTSTTVAGAVPAGTLDTNGLKLAMPSFLTTAMQSNVVTISNINVSAGTTSGNLSALTFSDGSGVSFGLNAGTLTGSVAAQTVQSVGVYASSQTIGQSSSSTIDARSLSIVGAGIISVGLSAGSLVVSAAGGAAQSAIKGLGVSNTGNTAGNTGVSTGIDWALAASGLLTLSQSTAGGGPNTIWVQHPAWLTTAMQSASSSNFAATGFTTTTAAGAVVAGTLDTTGLKLAVPAFLTTAMQSNAATISAINFSAGTTSQNLSKLTFADSNGVSFGLNGSVVTATVATNYLTTAMQSASSSNFAATGFTTTTAAGAVVAGTLNTAGLKLAVPGYLTTAMASNAATISNINVSAGSTSGNLSALTFSNGSGVSFGLNASVVTASVAAQTNQSIGIYVSSQTTAQSSSSTVDARSLTVVGMGNISAGMSAGSLVISGAGGGGGSLNLSAGTTSQNLSAVTFADSNGVSFGLNGSVVTASVVAGGGFTGSWYALGNTTQNSSSALASYSLNGLGAMTVGFSNGSIQLSAPASSSLVGTSGISISTAGNTISVVGQSFSAQGAITFSPANGNTVSVSVPAVPLLSHASFVDGGGTVVSSLGNATLFLQPFVLQQNGSFNQLNHWCNPSAAATASHSSQSTRSNQWSMGRTYGLYAQGTGTNSTRLESVCSFSVSMSGAVAYGHSSNGASATASHVVQFAGLSQIDSAGGVTYTTISGTSSASGSTNSSTSVGNTFTAMMTGTKIMAVPFATSLSGGNYWLAMVGRSSSTSQASNSTVMSYSNIMQTAVSASYLALMGGTTVNTAALGMGHGIYSASAATLPATIAFTEIKGVTGQVLQPFVMKNMTL